MWQKAHQLVLRVYRMTRTFPKSESYGLVAQMRRAAVSASLEELRYYFILAADLEYAATAAERESTDELGRMLHAYIDTLKSSKES